MQSISQGSVLLQTWVQKLCSKHVILSMHKKQLTCIHTDKQFFLKGLRPNFKSCRGRFEWVHAWAIAAAMWTVTSSVWAVIAATCAVTASLWAVTSATCAVTAAVRTAVHADYFFIFSENL